MLLLALFIAVPLIEIALFIQVGSLLGLGWTLLIVVLTALLGTYLVRQQGRDVLRQVQGSINEMRDPTEPLAHGAMILFSGALLLTPGFFTDAVGFALLIPPVRVAAFRWLRKRMVVHSAGFTAHRQGPGRKGPADPGIIDGEFEEVEPKRRSPDEPSGWTRH